MKHYIKDKIDEAFKIALVLGLKGATETEKELFKKSLTQIAVVAIDEVRDEIGDLLHKKSYEYI